MNHGKIKDSLPQVYQPFLPQFFESRIPKETAATCSDCAMCLSGEEGFPNGIRFSKDTKCCTHYPTLPNYLVGALLSSSDPDLETGRQRIREKITHGFGVTPHGIARSGKYRLFLKTSPNVFGRSRSLRCPYFEIEGGRCSIWSYRNATCNTWFCKYENGLDGFLFWSTLRRYLKGVETDLVHYALHKMGWDPKAIISEGSTDGGLTVEEIDDRPPDPQTYQGMWKAWKGREEDFYKETYHLVEALTRKEFDRLSGITQTIRLEELKSRHLNVMRPELPEVLQRNPKLEVVKTGEDTYALVSYSPLDTLEISKRVYDMLDYFDGRRPVEELRRVILGQMEMEPTADLILSLYQFRILVGHGGE